MGSFHIKSVSRAIARLRDGAGAPSLRVDFRYGIYFCWNSFSCYLSDFFVFGLGTHPEEQRVGQVGGVIGYLLHGT